jgi:hypothetical protein
VHFNEVASYHDLNSYRSSSGFYLIFYFFFFYYLGYVFFYLFIDNNLNAYDESDAFNNFKSRGSFTPNPACKHMLFFFFIFSFIKLIKYSIISNQFTVYENNNCNQTHLEKHHKNKKMSRDLTETESNEASIKLNLKIIDEPKVLIFCFCKL